MRRTQLLALVLALLIAAAAVSVALAASSGKRAAKPHAKHARAAAAAKSTATQSVKAVSVAATRLAKPQSRGTARSTTRVGEDNPGENTAADPDNIQQGDQSGPADNPQGGESESTSGDASIDHVEQPAGADHQCPPDCAPGEQP